MYLQCLDSGDLHEFGTASCPFSCFSVKTTGMWKKFHRTSYLKVMIKMRIKKVKSICDLRRHLINEPEQESSRWDDKLGLHIYKITTTVLFVNYFRILFLFRGGGMSGGRHISRKVKIIYTKWILRVTVIRMESAVRRYFPALECYWPSKRMMTKSNKQTFQRGANCCKNISSLPIFPTSFLHSFSVSLMLSSSFFCSSLRSDWRSMHTVWRLLISFFFLCVLLDVE